MQIGREFFINDYSDYELIISAIFLAKEICCKVNHTLLLKLYSVLCATMRVSALKVHLDSYMCFLFILK
jgi:hypothetical protein